MHKGLSTSLINLCKISQEADGIHEPDWTCSFCGNQEGFVTIEYNTDWGIEYDIKCTECGSTEIEESPELVLRRSIEERDKLKEEIERLENIIKQLQSEK